MSIWNKNFLLYDFENYFGKSYFWRFEKLWKMLFKLQLLEIRNYEKIYYYLRNPIFGF
jgi:hypothetical protein